ncbi:MAG TPA: DNA alkylation repair protein, partial [Rubrivivax sp.]|nr:DNA alkylation repair protein [Rubrivivax sp.]
MAEPFKNLLNAQGVRELSRHLRRAWPGFDARRFERQALAGLDALEMKARAMQIATHLEPTLPADFGAAAGVIEASLAPAPASDTLPAQHGSAVGLAGRPLWPVGEFVARRGLATP